MSRYTTDKITDEMLADHGSPSQRRNRRFRAPQASPPQQVTVGDWADWPWTLLPLIPAATHAALGTPSTTVWHFQLDHP